MKIVINRSGGGYRLLYGLATASSTATTFCDRTASRQMVCWR